MMIHPEAGEAPVQGTLYIFLFVGDDFWIVCYHHYQPPPSIFTTWGMPRYIYIYIYNI